MDGGVPNSFLRRHENLFLFVPPWAPSPLRWARRETETTASIAGSAARAFAQPTLAQANRLFQQGLSFGSPESYRLPEDQNRKDAANAEA